MKLTQLRRQLLKQNERSTDAFFGAVMSHADCRIQCEAQFQMIRPIVLTLLACCAVASTRATKHDPHLVWNASASAPIGLYAEQP